MPLYPITDTHTGIKTLVEAKNGPRALEYYLEGRFVVGGIIKDPVDVATAVSGGVAMMLEGSAPVEYNGDYSPLGYKVPDCAKDFHGVDVVTVKADCPVAAFTAGMEDCDKGGEATLLPPLGGQVVVAD